MRSAAPRPPARRFESTPGQMLRPQNSIACWSGNGTGLAGSCCIALPASKQLQELGVRFIATIQGFDTDWKNPASQFLLHVPAAAAEFERSSIRERTQAGRPTRIELDFDSELSVLRRCNAADVKHVYLNTGNPVSGLVFNHASMV